MAGDPFEDPVVHKQYLKIALSGEGGSGKTRALLSFPKVCVIDTEKGTLPYRGKYDFKVKILNRWKQLDGVLKWLRANPGVYETLAIDSMTIFYLDLIQEIVEIIKNKRGNEIMTTGDWGVEKRRWAACLNQLVELPINVILSFREKAEYEDSLNKAGDEVRKKTGSFLAEADKQTEYLFDLGYRCHTELNKKDKTTKFLMTCTKTRFDWSPKYGIWDVTGKRVFQEFFAPHAAKMLDAPDAPVVEPTEPILILPDPTPTEKVSHAIETVAKSEPGQSDTMETLNKLFSYPKPDASQPEASLEDIKVMMTRWGKIVWPDPEKKCRFQSCQEQDHNHPSTTKAEGKSLLLAAYDVASSKELRKPQVDFLYHEFGKVLSGLAFMARDANGAVYIATPPGETEEEVRANVLKWE